MKILAIQNCRVEGFGLYEQFLAARHIDYQVFHACQGQPFPPLEAFDRLLIGGTPISAYAAREHPFLQAECDYLQRALAMHKPCFGICCGAQLLAQLLGVGVHKCGRKEIGGYEVRLTLAGQSDPLLDGFPLHFPVFQWHGDTFDIPQGAMWLAEGDNCRNQLFRLGNVVGVQFHLEVESRDAAIWTDEYAGELAEVGKSQTQVVAECREWEREMKTLAEQLLVNWLKVGGKLL